MYNRDSLEETSRTPRAEPDEPSGRTLRSNPSDIPLRVWVFALLAAILLFALFGFWALYLVRGRLGAEGPTPTAIIWTPTPSPTPAISLTPTPTEPPASEEAGPATPTASTAINVGDSVTVTGTEGYGLSLREGPGPNYARMDVAAEGEVFVVVEGPHTAAGSPWWRIRDPENEERVWWAIGNYLEPTEPP